MLTTVTLLKLWIKQVKWVLLKPLCVVTRTKSRKCARSMVLISLVLKLYTSRWIRKQLPKRYKWYVTRKLTLSWKVWLVPTNICVLSWTRIAVYCPRRPRYLTWLWWSARITTSCWCSVMPLLSRPRISAKKWLSWSMLPRLPTLSVFNVRRWPWFLPRNKFFRKWNLPRMPLFLPRWEREVS